MTPATRTTLRQLCSLGLPGPLLLPSLLPVLRAWVPADHGAFFYCDERGSITNFYPERMLPHEAMARYHDRHNDTQFRAQYQQRLAAEKPTSRRSVTAAERASAYYQEVLAPLGVEHFCMRWCGTRVWRWGSSVCTGGPSSRRFRTRTKPR
ncbi:hypothetical protein [Ideonella paludis]|uniref:hypothetical protein n=1 Tax=Ideonella paludis TaxID=1233411 RepID=UPI00364581D6